MHKCIYTIKACINANNVCIKANYVCIHTNNAYLNIILILDHFSIGEDHGHRIHEPEVISMESEDKEVII